MDEVSRHRGQSAVPPLRQIPARISDRAVLRIWALVRFAATWRAAFYSRLTRITNFSLESGVLWINSQNRVRHQCVNLSDSVRLPLKAQSDVYESVRGQFGSLLGNVLLRPFIVAARFARLRAFSGFHFLDQVHVSGEIAEAFANDLLY